MARDQGPPLHSCILYGVAGVDLSSAVAQGDLGVRKQ